MRQQTASMAEARASLLIMFLVLALAVAFLALVNVQTYIPLPEIKTPVGMLLAGMSA